AVVEEGVERVGDVALIYTKGAGERARSARCARAARLRKRGVEVQGHVGGGVTEVRGEAGWQIGGCQIVERGAVETACRREDGVGARHIAPGREDSVHRTRERGAAAGRYIGARRSRGIDLHQIERTRLEGEIALYGHRAGRRPGRENAAAVNRGCA